MTNNSPDLNLGKYQFEALKALSVQGGVVEATDLPQGVDSWVLHRLAERGLIKLSATLTERGAQAVFRKEEIEADKAERRERMAIRARLLRCKLEQERIEKLIRDNPIEPPPIQHHRAANLVAINTGRTTRPKKALPSEFTVDKRRLMGAR